MRHSIYSLAIAALFVFILPDNSALTAADDTQHCVQKHDSSGGKLGFPILGTDLQQFLAKDFTEISCPAMTAEHVAAYSARCDRMEGQAQWVKATMKELYGLTPQTMCAAYRRWVDQFGGSE